MPVLPNCLTSYAALTEHLGISSGYSGGDKASIEAAINDASAMIEQFIGRDLKINDYTEYYDGRGEPIVLLDHWPIQSSRSSIEVYDDTNRLWPSSTQLTYSRGGSTDELDWTDKEGEAGIIRRVDANFDDGDMNVKVVYTAGFSEYFITPDNNKLDIDEGSGEETITLTSGQYTGSELATEIETQLEAVSSAAYTVSYDKTIHRMTLTKSSGTFTIYWNSGTNVSVSDNLARLLGFDTENNDTGALTYTSNHPMVGVPYMLEYAAILLAEWNYRRAKEKRIGVTSSARGDEATTFSFDIIPTHIKRRIEPYRQRKVG